MKKLTENHQSCMTLRAVFHHHMQGSNLRHVKCATMYIQTSSMMTASWPKRLPLCIEKEGRLLFDQDNQVIDSSPGVVPAACSDDKKLCDGPSTCPAISPECPALHMPLSCHLLFGHLWNYSQTTNKVSTESASEDV